MLTESMNEWQLFQLSMLCPDDYIFGRVYLRTKGLTAPCLVAAWSQGGSLETPPRWHATIYILAENGEREDIDRLMDGQAEGRYQAHYLPASQCCVVDNQAASQPK